LLEKNALIFVTLSTYNQRPLAFIFFLLYRKV